MPQRGIVVYQRESMLVHPPNTVIIESGCRLRNCGSQVGQAGRYHHYCTPSDRVHALYGEAATVLHDSQRLTLPASESLVLGEFPRNFFL